MLRLKGMPLSPGVARGVAYVYSDIIQGKQAGYSLRRDQYDSEYARILGAKEKVRSQLFSSAHRIGAAFNKNVADIFLAQEAMLVDPQLVADLKQTFRQKHVNAEQVVGTVFRRWIRKFRDAPSKMLNERADDLEDLYRRMLGVLIGVETNRLENLGENTILVARRLLPSDTVFLSPKTCLGILLEVAGPTAHSTILARELGIPLVGKVADLIYRIVTGNEILVDGSTGDVTVNPTPQAVLAFDAVRDRYTRKSASAWKRRFDKARTAGGNVISVSANVGSREDVERAADSGADGIGLFRTEGFFLAAKQLPSAGEFGRFLLHCLEPIGNKPVNLRLLDIGGDKKIPYLSLPFELNPFLGRRGIRLLFEFPALLNIQLEAMLSVSQTRPIRILIPMVTFAEEIIRIRRMIGRIAKRKHIHPPPLGAMIETPTAALEAVSISKHADFLCVGTNDLTQYMMAADRESALITEYFRDDHPVIFSLLRSISAGAGRVPVTLCGELASKREALDRIVKTGIRALSIAPPHIPAIKEAIRHIGVHPHSSPRRP